MFARSTSTVCFALLLGALPLGGCGTAREAYYNAWEKAGYAKRDRLVDNVKAARDEQDVAKTQFTSALDQFKQITKFEGGDLEKAYNKLKSEYDGCAQRAEAVRERIKSVRNVGGALFTEWKGEIRQIEDDAALQKQSRALYDKTYEGYETLLERMDAAAASMKPVLTKYNNRVLFLKANLNAQAIGSLAGTEVDLGKDIDELVRQMQASITEADQFMAGLKKG
ncbi:MAG TPA: DUF2959 family protein [Tepidisphaeraceae bacterium]|jgi:hypothetical protein